MDGDSEHAKQVYADASSLVSQIPRSSGANRFIVVRLYGRAPTRTVDFNLRPAAIILADEPLGRLKSIIQKITISSPHQRRPPYLEHGVAGGLVWRVPINEVDRLIAEIGDIFACEVRVEKRRKTWGVA